MRTMFFGATLVLASCLAGCASSQMAMPNQLVATTERLELAGMGGWQDGQWRMGGSEGRFTRRSTETKLFDTFVRKAGGATFDLAGPEIGGSIGGRCGFDELEIDLGTLAVPNGRLTYRCAFHRDGRPIDGGMFLAEVPNGSGLLAGRTRAGELQLAGLTLAIRPIHRAQGGGLPAGMPLGYAFDVSGRQIGAVDINGIKKTIYAPRQAGPEREAVLMASLALSAFWDPGE